MERTSQNESLVMAMNSDARESVLVVVEGEAACFEWMGHWGDAPVDGWSLLEQETWEPSEMFSERLHTTLARSAQESAARPTLVLVASGNPDAFALAARCQVAASLMNHLAACGGGRLLLTRGYGHDGRPDAALDALREDLLEEWADSDIQIIVCLDEQAPTSEIRNSPSVVPAMRARRYDSEPAARAF